LPGSLDRPTGGTRYDRRIVAELCGLGFSVEVASLATAFPMPSADDLAAAETMIAGQPAGVPVIIDGLAFGVMADAAARLATTRPLIALVHHPLALETGLTREMTDFFRMAEQDALRHAAAIVVTSPAMRKLLVKDYDVPASRIHVAPPGVDMVEAPIPRINCTPVRFLTVGSLIPRKGHGDLVEAFAAIRDLDWQAEIVGDATMDPALASGLARQIADCGLQDRVRLTGAIGEAALAQRYAAADCFVLASRYEGYGMAYMEALAAGLPVIGTTGAAEAIGRGGAMVVPGDVDGLAALLRDFVTNPDARAGYRARALERADELPRWRDAAHVIADVVIALTSNPA
jgi:glycosyltransferase involved in cell wall biosynthesis